MERDCESELSKLNIEQNACIYHFGASVIHGQRSNILRLRFYYNRKALDMNIAAYCRVSTDKADQLNSLEAQKEFFSEYTQRTGDNLVRLYADEGISGTKIKNRKEFLRMMADAEHGLFDMVVVRTSPALPEIP